MGPRGEPLARPASARKDQHVPLSQVVVPAMPAMEDLTSAEPGNLHWRQGLCRVWEVLARLQGAAGREAESRDSAGKALAIARDLARTDPAYFYDLACALCLHGRLFSSVRDLEEGTEVLDRAIKEGFDDDHRLRTDFRLDGLRRRVVAAPPGSPK